MIIEILSPGIANHDRQLKKQLYQRNAVPEFWIVDRDSQAIEQYRLENRQYVRVDEPGDEISLQVLPQVSIKLAGLWDFDF